MPLTLTRKQGEKIMIGDDIVISFVHGSRGQVRFIISAPLHVEVHREEIYYKIKKDNENVSLS